MLLKNTSRHPTDEVRRLLDYAADGFDLRGVAVHIKNSKHAYRGLAYERVPRIANAHANASRLVTIGIGSPDKFPTDNMRTVVRWINDDTPIPEPEGSPEYEAYWREHRSVGHCVAGVQTWTMQRRIVDRHPYGGKGSPLIEIKNWREAIVAIGAHEFMHIHQFQNNLRRSEVDAERAAAKRLAAYRHSEASP